VLFSTVILLFFGGKVLQDLAFVLTVGTITGTYSTIYIAGALVVDWTLYVEQRLRRSPRSRGSAGGTVQTPARKKAAVKG
jgi:preprotein translocase subunit SecF